MAKLISFEVGDQIIILTPKFIMPLFNSITPLRQIHITSTRGKHAHIIETRKRRGAALLKTNLSFYDENTTCHYQWILAEHCIKCPPNFWKAMNFFRQENKLA